MLLGTGEGWVLGFRAHDVGGRITPRGIAKIFIVFMMFMN
jgi:hypothetical protein